MLLNAVNFVTYLKPLPDKEVILYETGLVQQQKRTMNEVAVQSDQEQTAFKVCRRYGVSSVY